MNDYRDLGLGFFGAVAALAAYIGLVGACFGGETLQATIVTDAPAERQYVPQTGDRVICNDFTYIIMAVPDWELWTNRISQLEAVASRRWANEHKTDAGRRAWHGAVVKTERQAEQRQVVYTYADGYQWTEKMHGGYSRPVNADRNTATNRPPQGGAAAASAQPACEAGCQAGADGEGQGARGQRHLRPRRQGHQQQGGAVMRKYIVIVTAAMLAACCFGKGLLPSQVHRRGLDNWQIDDILAKHPTAVLRISAADWRGMRYQLHRFNNMTNYVEEIGSSNDCAKVLLRLTDAKEQLTASNGVLRVMVAEATARADAAEYDAHTLHELQKAAKRTEKNLSKVIKTLEQAKKKASSDEEAALYTAIINILQGNDPN